MHITDPIRFSPLRHGVLAVITIVSASTTMAEPPRLLVLTDIGGDPDDQQSMVRLMNYSNEFKIEGLISTSNLGHNNAGIQPNLIEDIVGAYGQVRPNLLVHAPHFPTEQYLRDRIKTGRTGVTANNPSFGAGLATSGSNHIISVVDDPSDQRPVWVTIWGGSNELAQALYDVKHDPNRTEQQKAQFVQKLRVYAIGDQDGAGAWIKSNFPQLRYIESTGSNAGAGGGAFRGMYQNNSTGEQELVKPEVRPLVWENEWVRPNVTKNHGPLGALYPANVGQNPGVGGINLKGVKEGDTPAWFFLLSERLGLSDPADPTQGGWGGRFRKAAGANEHYVDGEDQHYRADADAATRRKWTVARWREAYQNDFAARMDWNVATTFEQANHAPVVTLNTPTRVTAAPGMLLSFDASGSSDPDGNALNFEWFFYDDPSSYSGPLGMEGASSALLKLTAPDVEQIQSIHLILAVTDVPSGGLPPMTRYERVIVTVDPNFVPEPSAGLMGLAGAALLAGRRARRP
jgi:hypothetical protein